MASISWILGPAALLASASNASVTPPADHDAEAIEIIAKAPPQVRREASEYLRRLGTANGNKPAGRWLDPICPHVIGLEATSAAQVEQQVRTVAKLDGAPVDGTSCKANLLIVFTDDAKGVVRSVLRKVGTDFLSPADRRALESGEAPVRWWYNSEFRDRDGISSSVISPALRIDSEFNGGTLAGGVPSNDKSISITHSGSSAVSTQVVRALTHVTVVIDAGPVRGKSLRSLVDYAALVGLAEIRLGATAPASVLGLFSAGSTVDELTATDHAFLKALYAMSLDRKAEQHRRVLVGQIIRDRLGKN